MSGRETVAVLGTGWLGTPLLRSLTDSGYVARGSFRRPEKGEEIVEAGAEPISLDLPDSADRLSAFLADTAALVITLPPGGRRWGAEATERYLAQLEVLSPHFRGDLRVVYTSSTGVYGNVEGRVTEDTPVAPDSDSGRAVVAAERWLSDHVTGSLAVLRLGGLYGPDRDPVRFFRQRDAIPDGDAPVNMLSLHQALSALRFAIERRIDGTFNVCGMEHPTKREFYGALYREAGLPVKPFLAGGAAGKRIDSSKLRRLGWH